jgi:hypothetical protein
VIAEGREGGGGDATPDERGQEEEAEECAAPSGGLLSTALPFRVHVSHETTFFKTTPPKPSSRVR